MDIMLEAQEYHNIEQNDRKSKYWNKYKKEIEPKAERWMEIENKFKETKKVPKEDTIFIVNECKFLYEKNLIDKVPYFDNHQRRIKYEEEYLASLELYAKVIPEFKELVKSAYWVSPGWFGNTKTLTSLKEQANHLLEKHKNTLESLENILNENIVELVEWEKDKEKFYELEKLFKQGKELSHDDLVWVKQLAARSIMEQLTTGNLFFEHHFTRVRSNERIYKELEACKKLFTKHHKFIKYLSKVTVYSFGNKDNLEEVRQKSRDAKYNEFMIEQIVDRVIKEVQEAKEESEE